MPKLSGRRADLDRTIPIRLVPKPRRRSAFWNGVVTALLIEAGMIGFGFGVFFVLLWWSS